MPREEATGESRMFVVCGKMPGGFSKSKHSAEIVFEPAAALALVGVVAAVKVVPRSSERWVNRMSELSVDMPIDLKLEATLDCAVMRVARTRIELSLISVHVKS